jgi:hypothetical protein
MHLKCGYSSIFNLLEKQNLYALVRVDKKLNKTPKSSKIFRLLSNLKIYFIYFFPVFK